MNKPAPAMSRSRGRVVAGSVSVIVGAAGADFEPGPTPGGPSLSVSGSSPDRRSSRQSGQIEKAGQPCLLRKRWRRDHDAAVEAAQVDLHRARRAVVAERTRQYRLADQVVRAPDPDHRAHVAR